MKLEWVNVILPLLTLSFVFRTDKIRKIVGDIFRKPSSRSVVVTVGKETFVFDNVTPDHDKQIIDAAMARHFGEPEPPWKNGDVQSDERGDS